MNGQQQEAYDEGYRAYNMGAEDHSNPYDGLLEEFWSDGYEDAAEDEAQSQRAFSKTKSSGKPE